MNVRCGRRWEHIEHGWTFEGEPVWCDGVGIDENDVPDDADQVPDPPSHYDDGSHGLTLEDLPSWGEEEYER